VEIWSIQPLDWKWRPTYFFAGGPETYYPLGFSYYAHGMDAGMNGGPASNSLLEPAIAAPAMGMDMGMDADAGMPDLRCRCHLSGLCTSRAMKYLGLYSNIQGHEHCFWTRRFWPRCVCHSFLVLWATGQAWTRLASSCALTTGLHRGHLLFLSCKYSWFWISEGDDSGFLSLVRL
jgi:hypothetical protein